MQTRQGDKERKIEDIKQAFIQLVTANGYETVSIRQIAKKVNVSVGLIYHYFPGGKPAIATTIYRESAREDKVMYATCGPPCEHEYSEYRL